MVILGGPSIPDESVPAVECLISLPRVVSTTVTTLVEYGVTRIGTSHVFSFRFPS